MLVSSPKTRGTNQDQAMQLLSIARDWIWTFLWRVASFLTFNRAECRICHEVSTASTSSSHGGLHSFGLQGAVSETLEMSACRCKGSVACIHKTCLARCMLQSGSPTCQVWKQPDTLLTTQQATRAGLAWAGWAGWELWCHVRPDMPIGVPVATRRDRHRGANRLG